eukprot:TRINITY_DN9110_c0_g1_i1.p1 TRINITY_DN9110_c0_g1~~TRINITY_DN9110_c0_g1_i1.p1  ORF type:complete len:262 (-),score=28.61 TRINITY_DN9110_c0_g1_i1:150-914(-)
MAQVSFQSIPIELHTFIVSFLSAHDIAAFGQTCRSYYQISRSEYPWSVRLQTDFGKQSPARHSLATYKTEYLRFNYTFGEWAVNKVSQGITITNAKDADLAIRLSSQQENHGLPVIYLKDARGCFRIAGGLSTTVSDTPLRPSSPSGSDVSQLPSDLLPLQLWEWRFEIVSLWDGFDQHRCLAISHPKLAFMLRLMETSTGWFDWLEKKPGTLPFRTWYCNVRGEEKSLVVAAQTRNIGLALTREHMGAFVDCV